PARDGAAVGTVHPVARNVELGERMFAFERRGILEIPAGAEGASFAPEHRNRGRRIAVELEEGLRQRIGAVRVHRVARLGTRMNHRPHRSVLLDPHRHVVLLVVRWLAAWNYTATVPVAKPEESALGGP